MTVRLANPIDRLLEDGLAFTGESPFGSCFQHAVANVLHVLGLESARWSPGLSWGFSWDGTTARLKNSQRWTNHLSVVSGVQITRLCIEHWDEAKGKEQELLGMGAPLVAGVDSFNIQSPHSQARHLVHAVIVVHRDCDSVTFCDPMNEPRPTTVSAREWEALRRASCVERHELIACEGWPSEQLDADSVVSSLADDLEVCRASDSRDLAAFTEHIETSGTTGLDVADVGAERLYAGELIASLSRQDASLATHARALSALARRWYLLHTLALESGGSLSARRAARILGDIASREADARAAFVAWAAERSEREAVR